MPARPFQSSMGRARCPVHGGTHALAFAAVLVCSAWAGAHGLGVVVGWVVAVAAVVALVGGLVVGGALFAGWAVRQIRAEIEAQR